MCEINVNNFKKKFSYIKKTLENSKFVSLDLEFSALYPLKNLLPSLFDSPKERYTKLRRNLEYVVPLQIGLTAFSFDPDSNSYNGTVFTFYVQPATFQFINRSYFWQSESVNFLKTHKFDFNKVLYTGIPFINRDQETELRQKFKNNEISEVSSGCKAELEDIFEEEGEIVKKWYPKANVGDALTIPKICEKYKSNDDILYFVHKNFRIQFKNLWTCIENEEFTVKKVTEEEYLTLEKKYNLEEELLESLLGFTRVFRLLVSLRKPIVGHNLLQDVLLMLVNFETALPLSYETFKRLSTDLFPVIFDTKAITYEMRNDIPPEKQWKDTGLDKLFDYFKNGTGRHLVKNSPAIEIENEVENSYGKFHDAGWDSFCAGYIFIRLAYFNVYKQFPKSKQFVSSELIGGLMHLKNKVNVIRAAISSINLDGADPNSTRPPYLVVESAKNRPVDIPQVTSVLSSYGFVEVKKFPFQSKRAIVAVDNFGNARRILNNFKANAEFQVKPYNVVRHSTVVRAFLVNITLEEWDQFTRDNIENAAKEINSARQFRAYTDVLIKQAIEDLWNQYHAVNDAFRRRIEEMKEIKTKMEVQHSEIARQANEMTRTITRLEKALQEKEGYMALAHTRLGNRAQRPGVELCKDQVQLALLKEVKEMRYNLNDLQHVMSEAHASLRYLLKTQIQLEEDLNIKTNSLKIDEVDCMTIRQCMDYHAY